MGADSFRDCVLEQLSALPGLCCKRMFGGHGLYAGEVFFGITSGGRLYFKTHSGTLADYRCHDAPVFAPSEKQVLKNYREVAINILKDAWSLLLWAKKAAG